MKITNMPEANQYIRHNYRQGWTLYVGLRTSDFRLRGARLKPRPTAGEYN